MLPYNGLNVNHDTTSQGRHTGGRERETMPAKRSVSIDAVSSENKSQLTFKRRKPIENKDASLEMLDKDMKSLWKQT